MWGGLSYWPGPAHLTIFVSVFAWLLGNNAEAHAYKLRTLHSFCSEFNCADGYNHYSSSELLVDSAGNLYGSTPSGGTHGGGVAFELFREPGKTKWRFKVLYNFCARAGCTDGSPPSSGALLMDIQGNLFGVTPAGGSAGSGTVFELTPNRTGKYWILHTLYNFCAKNSGCPDGQRPAALTYQGAAVGEPYDDVSPLYGITELGGKHQGGIAFSLSPSGKRYWDEQKLFVFCREDGCTDGGFPQLLTVDPSGTLVGVGELPNQFMMFRLSPVVGQNRWAETILYTFCSLANCSDGNYPSGTPLIDLSGNIFGVTYEGGTAPQCPYSSGCGVVYKIAPDNTETVLYDFCHRKNCEDGSFPDGRLTMDVSGNLFGTTAFGGRYDNVQGGGGTAFVLSGSSLRTMRSFCAEANCPDGAYPGTGVVLNSAGEAFGTTPQGGDAPQSAGTVFELKP